MLSLMEHDALVGLVGLVERELPWIFWMWCLAYRS